MKCKHMVWTPASNVPNGFDLDHDPDLWIVKVKCDLDFWPYAWRWQRIFMVKFWNGCMPQWESRLTLNEGDGSRSFMAMTVTIWWPRSGVLIYQIVTEVTSAVGVPWTHLVIFYGTGSLTILAHIRQTDLHITVKMPGTFIHPVIGDKVEMGHGTFSGISFKAILDFEYILLK